ncbi:endonuclease/exonuclease/phosphatase family protein [Micromonospora sp. DR5-3]|uniref:endonuclease/exonuclease/phosphatase family protein n=1 Tax=unclassified Micromonospora TaxID=2617518 RepID=UPI0011D93140|nr:MULTISPECIES: endonuclease/exonuclease/phosphatase family protein [unclassified Micromonospora]MCW3819943.1 endonuclease/exonuclease/phosphatase family protein [Micromonospora sp. DR5-3]TYC19989.1 endonuclease [Micromonospora sp. MP36]
MPGPGVPLRVVSYNVHSQRDDTAALAEVVRAAAPDVVIVQEGPRRFRWRQKCASLADSFGLVVAAGGLPALGNLLLTSLRVRVLATRCQRYPLTPGRHLRGAAYAECLVGGSRFLLAGSHLATDPAERPAQAAAFKRELAAATLPVVAGVDLNEEPDGPAWRTVAAGLTDAAVAADRADRHTFSCAHPHRRIDALFVDPRITVVDYDVVDTPRTRRASDHFPLLVDLLLPADG